MPHRVNDDLALCRLVEVQTGVGRRHAADRRIVRAATDLRVLQQKIDQGLDAGLNPRAPCGECAAM